MRWRELSVTESETLYKEYCGRDRDNNLWEKCPVEYLSMKSDLEHAFAEVMMDLDIGPEDIQRKSQNYAYLVDLLFGLKLYRILNDKYGMTVRQASTAGIWRYISMMVVPQIIEQRYGVDHPDRFWKKSKRLWYRVLWWYIYLSWQGDEESTYAVLKDNSTDEILQLVDRAGKGGYRVELCRALIRENAKRLKENSEWRKQQMFRKLMVLNTARLQAIEPGLVEGGEAAYVEGLIQYFMTGREKK